MGSRRRVLAGIALLLVTVLLLSGCVGGGGGKPPVWQHKLRISTEGEGEVTTVLSHWKLDTPVVELQAVPAEHWRFDRWIGDVSDENSATTTVELDTEMVVTAVFVQEPAHNGLTITFADQNLEEAIRELVRKPEGDITYTDVVEVKNLSAPGRGIESLEGLEHLPNLEMVDLRYNQISDLTPFGRNSRLWQLKLSGNKITDIEPLGLLQGLRDLELDDNQISDLSPLEELSNLSSLSAANNQIDDLSPLTALRDLGALNLAGNQIADIGALSGLTNLAFLNLGDNLISGIGGLLNLKTLLILDLSGNQITDISILPEMTILHHLYLGGNQISDISPLAAMRQLWDLDLQDNQIEDISYLEGLTELRMLNLAENRISDISALVDNSGLGRDDVVHLEKNYLDLTPGSAAMGAIQTLLSRGVEVDYEPQYTK